MMQILLLDQPGMMKTGLFASIKDYKSTLFCFWKQLAKTKTNQILDMHMCLNYFGMVSLVYTLNWPLEKMMGILILSILCMTMQI